MGKSRLLVEAARASRRRGLRFVAVRGNELVREAPFAALKPALRHLVELLENDPHNPPLRAGETISTGTLTLAAPVSVGESWTTKISGIPLEEITLRFE